MVGAGLPALGWKATKPAGRTSGKRGQARAYETEKDTLRGKRGIIFFKDYWQRTINGKKEFFRNRSGDHIDL